MAPSTMAWLLRPPDRECTGRSFQPKRHSCSPNIYVAIKLAEFPENKQKGGLRCGASQNCRLLFNRNSVFEFSKLVTPKHRDQQFLNSFCESADMPAVMQKEENTVQHTLN